MSQEGTQLFALIVGFRSGIIVSPQIGITESLFAEAAANQMIMYFQGVPIPLGGSIVQEVTPGIWEIEINEAKKKMLNEFVNRRFPQNHGQEPTFYIASEDAINALRKAA